MYFTRSEGVSVSCTWLLTLAAQHIAELSLGVDVQQQILDRVGQDRPALSWTLLGLEGLHWASLSSFPLIAMQTDQLPTLGDDGWNVYHSVDRWAPPPQATPPLYLHCHPFFFSVRAPYQCSFELPPLSIIDFNTVSFKSYLLSSQCRPLSKCHTEIYATVSCQTRLLLVRGFGREKKSIFAANQWRQI